MTYVVAHLNAANRASSGIYQIRNLVDGKLYVGSAVKLGNRWNVHKYGLSKGKHHSVHLQRAWEKYGADSFAFEVLQTVEDRTLLIATEQRWLDELDVVSNGYNITPNAGSSLGRVLSAESKEKMAKKKRGIQRTIEARAKQSASTTGVPHSLEHREKLAAKNRARAASTLAARTIAKESKRTAAKEVATARRMTKAVFANCKTCTTTFRTKPSYIAKGGAKYCCQVCYRAARPEAA